MRLKQTAVTYLTDESVDLEMVNMKSLKPPVTSEIHILYGTFGLCVVATILWIISISTDHWVYLSVSRHVVNDYNSSVVNSHHSGLWRICRIQAYNLTTLGKILFKNIRGSTRQTSTFPKCGRYCTFVFSSTFFCHIRFAPLVKYFVKIVVFKGLLWGLFGARASVIPCDSFCLCCKLAEPILREFSSQTRAKCLVNLMVFLLKHSISGVFLKIRARFAWMTCVIPFEPQEHI